MADATSLHYGVASQVNQGGRDQHQGFRNCGLGQQKGKSLI